MPKNTGAIYSCTATVGKQTEKLGSFWPKVSLDEERVARWKERDITTIEKCVSCPSALACGGGCAMVAAENGSKGLASPDCRPIPELVGLGLAHYFKSELVNG